MRIYIARHGQTDMNKENKLLGRKDVPLNETGKKQAEALKGFFRREAITFDKIYASPLKRAVNTAKIASERDDILFDDRLLEMDYGRFEGADLTDPPEEVKVFFSDFVNNPAPYDMESLESVVARLGDFLNDIKDDSSDTILILTHAIAMKGALEYLTPDSKGSYWPRYISNCSVFCFEYNNGSFTVPCEVYSI